MKKLVDGKLINMTAQEVAELEALRSSHVEPVPEEISDRQFFHALAILGSISQEEALAAVKTGEPPTAMGAFLDALPPEDEFNARMLLEGATTFRRSHPLTEAFGAGMSMSSEQIDALWRMAAAL